MHAACSYLSIFRLPNCEFYWALAYSKCEIIYTARVPVGCHLWAVWKFDHRTISGSSQKVGRIHFCLIWQLESRSVKSSDYYVSMGLCCGEHILITSGFHLFGFLMNSFLKTHDASVVLCQTLPSTRNNEVRVLKLN